MIYTVKEHYDTVRRDLSQLAEMKLLIKTKQGKALALLPMI